MNLGKKLGIYWLILIAMWIITGIGAAFGRLDSRSILFFLPIITMVVSTIALIWFMMVVYRDAPKRGLSKSWWLAVFLLGPIGGTIYYLKAKDKPKKQ